MDISLIIPAYHSAKFLEKNVNLIESELKKITRDYEILLVEGGSTDGTGEVAAGIAKKNRKVRSIHRKERLGKGKALSIGFRQASGEIAAFTDADLDISPKYLKPAIEKIGEGYDISIVSQHHFQSDFQSPALRKFLSKAYNFLVRAILGSNLKGHQGGLKCFRKSAIKKILPYIKDQWWFWDTEVLMVAQWLGFRVAEMPITGGYGFADSTVVPFKDGAVLFKSILWLKGRRLGELSRLKPVEKKSVAQGGQSKLKPSQEKS